MIFKFFINTATSIVILTSSLQQSLARNPRLTDTVIKTITIKLNLDGKLPIDTTPKLPKKGSTNNSARIGGTPGKLIGKIINLKSGEPVYDATITIKSGNITRVTKSDYNGVYAFNDLPEGTYTISVSHLSYGNKKLEDIKIVSKDVTTQDIVLQEAKGKNLEEVVVTTKGAGRVRESVAALLVQQKNAASVSDGISAEAIKRTPDKTTSDIMKRVSGASIQEDKFVIIRGLNDRYNAAFINNAPLPSSESDRKAFSFDVFPANMLDNLIIVKTATPDMNADFAGGSIFINTKDIPAKSFQSVTFGIGYNTVATFKDRKYEKTGKWDWVGLDDGTRKLSLPSTDIRNMSSNDKGELGKKLPNNWAAQSGNTPLNYNLQYVNGLNIQRHQKDFLGVLLAATYNKTYNLKDGEKKSITSFVPDYVDESTEKVYSSQVLAGLMGNISLKLNENNKFSLKNMVSVNSDDRVFERFYQGTFSKAQWFTSNTILSSQLAGEHFWKQPKIKINWTGGYTSVDRKIPYLRRTSYALAYGDSTKVQQNVSPEYGISNYENSGTIFTSATKENIKSFGADFLRKFSIDNDNSIQVKAGAYFQGRNRDFTARNLAVVQLGSFYQFDRPLLKLHDDSVFAPQNFGVDTNRTSGKNGFGLSEDFKADNTYSATSTLNAYYLMLDARVLKFIRINGGVRSEKFNQVLNSASDSVNTIVVDNLPSVNLIFSLTPKQNLRFSYSQTLNRPEYRELAPFLFYDYVTKLSIGGNPALERVKIENYDCRYEFYPSGGQLLSVSLFQKNIPNPIELVITPNSDAKYINAVEGKIRGVEFEFRANLGSTFKASPSSFLSNTTLFGNASFIHSEVSFGNDSLKFGRTRSLQGQSPYIYNAGLTYQDQKGYAGSLQVNYSAPRIYIAGDIDNPGIWENGRAVMDLQFAKTFEKQNLELKLNVKDILADDFIRFYDIDGNGKYDSNKDRLFQRGTMGRVISLGLTYKF